MSDLVERLRDDALHAYASATGAVRHKHLSEEAADQLEAKDKLIAELVEALEFYDGCHEPGLSRPSEGPWGVNSKDFGEVARVALSKAK